MRNLPADFRFGYTVGDHNVEYVDSRRRKILLAGRIYAPKGAGAFPAVIFAHGFNGHARDFSAECAAFAERGYVCYCFDFCGAQRDGGSVGRTASQYSPFTMKEDLLAAIGDIREQRTVDPAQIFLFGGSQGGFVTALTAADSAAQDKIAAIVLYFPAFNIPDDWREKPVCDTPLMGYSVGAEYLRSVRDLDPFAAIGNFKKDVCIIWGDRDALVARKYIDRAAAAYGDRAHLTVIGGAGHGFYGSALDDAIRTALAFLERHTVR